MPKLAHDPRHALNAVCPYFTMFPLEYPIRILKRYANSDTSVLDPFCGRGTTLYACRSLGLTAYGFDISRVAIAIAKAKLSDATPQQALDLAKELMGCSVSNVPRTKFFKHAFHLETLEQLCALRNGLLKIGNRRKAASLLRAAVLGCLHGPKNRVAAGYFSNQMPRTFAPKPDYAVRFWKATGEKPPKVRVLDVLHRKLSRIDESAACAFPSRGAVYRADATSKTSFSKIPASFSLVITSPPYYGMTTYVQDQWLRHWFLGGPEEVDYSYGTQVSHESQDSFVESLASVWRNVARSRAETVHLHIRFGAIPSIEVDPVAIIRKSLCAADASWRLVTTRCASSALSGKRQALQMAAISAANKEFDFHATRH